jgi:hypothetical protein
MATETAQPSLHDVGYRRLILVFGASWGAAPALTFLLGDIGTGADTALFAVGAAMTVTLAVLFELDSRTLAEYGSGVEMAWSYALLAPISIVAFAILGPGLLQIPLLGILGILVGPPAAALGYLWQRGREASVST